MIPSEHTLKAGVPGLGRLAAFLIVACLTIGMVLGLGSGCAKSALDRTDDPKLVRLKQAFKNMHFVAYTPLDYNPLVRNKPATPEGIRTDLLLLLTNRLTGIVTYSCSPTDGMDQIVPVASDLGLTVIVGIWDVKSVVEIETAVNLATRYTNVVGVIVGNETLLRGGTVENLEAAMNLVRAALPTVPISTSEPISSYGNEDLRRLADFHAPNIHWIFQGHDVGDYQAAANWLAERCRALRSLTYGDRPILVKEHGYPSGGNPTFTPQLQHDYWSFLLRTFPNSESHNIVVFEAFSLGWKTTTGPPEGAFSASEKYWGCWDENRNAKPVVDVLRAWR
jgi:exo-beta-1,3-glucanase (GH17 family)